MNETALVHVPNTELFMPLLSMEQAVQRREMFVQATQQLMREDVDFGKIPGTARPTLLQPGADKLCNLFGLVIRYDILAEVEDWTGTQHDGEPFFYYKVRGLAWKGDTILGEGIGSCNSREAKYRWRTAERVCPKCGAATIFRSKQEPGWFCWAKKGGCGARFPPGDQSIESQEVGRRVNPDIFDTVNTIQKIAFKRAKLAATINATSASEFFTQDMEDFAEGNSHGSHEDQAAVADRRIAEERAKAEGQGQAAPPPPAELPCTVAAPEVKTDVIPIEVERLWHRMKGLTSSLEVLRQLKQGIVEITGADQPYYEILSRYGLKHANLEGIKGLGLHKARLIARDLYEYTAKAKAALEPPEESPHEAVTDELPEEAR